MVGAALLLACAAQSHSPSAPSAPSSAVAPAFDHAHAAWSALLRDFVHPGGLVDYAGLAGRRAEVDAYLEVLRAVRAADFAAWTAPQREAFWINAYNAWTIALILDHPEARSIRDLGGLLSSVFDRRFVPLQHLTGGRKPLSLGEVEHAVLGRSARTPLFHFAIVCASRSCPELRAEAYDAARLDEQLAAQARVFLADATKNDGAIRDGRLAVSKIFDWSRDELERYPGGIRALLRDFGPPAVAQDPALAQVKLKHRDYDWTLNAWIPPAAPAGAPAGAPADARGSPPPQTR